MRLKIVCVNVVFVAQNLRVATTEVVMGGGDNVTAVAVQKWETSQQGEIHGEECMYEELCKYKWIAVQVEDELWGDLMQLLRTLRVDCPVLMDSVGGSIAGTVNNWKMEPNEMNVNFVRNSMDVAVTLEEEIEDDDVVELKYV
ncbi:hypothetical protein F0562_034134 [Nyssa sinensis]|uniref:Uncharacterized protein n=1 Tax=Nyssa sinensis TaxID=561372 RepID=A0A5J5AJ88_9ASTE|nr:hypothetical protein F0562_034134 [Nyssa sinensis]